VPAPRRPPFLTLALFALAAACAPRLDVRRRDGPPVDARAIAVYPYLFRWDEPPERSRARAMDAVQAALARRRLAVLAPTDFRCFDPEQRNVLLATDLAQVMTARGLPARAFLVMRGWAERRVARTVEQVDGDGSVRTTLHEQVAFLAHVEILDPDSSEPLVEVSARVDRRPGDGPAGDDPTPELTRLDRRLVHAALDALDARLAPARRVAPQ